MKHPRLLTLDDVDWRSTVRRFDHTMQCLRCGASCDGYYLVAVILDRTARTWGHLYIPCGCAGVEQMDYRVAPELMTALALAEVTT